MAVKNKKTKKRWFRPVRGSYLPDATEGWLSYIPFVFYLLASFFVTKDLKLSLLVRIYLIAVQWAFAGLFMTWIAKHNS